ncbi:MAG: Gfo/Idh/MocA family oxidoreductase [Candidatus Eisenbacteria bacterium]|nr:Gfo/Idh/MocA family oxidoreductase [Candidatus Eisenbacteria bacterium]
MLKVAVIGVGHLGRHHARVLSGLGGCELVGVHDTDGARAESIASLHGTRVFPDLDGLVGAVDAAVVAVPTSAHHAVASRCLDAGVHVLIEKPIASTPEEARDLVALARARGRLVQVGHVERFNPAIRAALTVLSAPRFIEAHRLGVFAPRGTDVAVVLDLMIHDIDLVLATVRSDVSRIEAVGVPVLSPSVDIANARLTFADGCVANVTASRVSRDKVRKIRFFQRDAYVSVDCSRPMAQVFRRKDVPRETLLAIARGEVPGGLADIVDYRELPLDQSEPLALELRSFADAVSGGRRPEVDGEDGLRALEVAFEILRQIGSHPGREAGAPEAGAACRPA